MAISPAMNRGFSAPGGSVPMDALHDRSRYFCERVSANDNLPPDYTDGNPVVVNAEALTRFCRASGYGSKWYKAACVYVIGEEDANEVKIGKAKSPSKRLDGLQIGNPRKLFLHRVFWFKNRDHASLIEYAAHKRAEATHERLVGEWFSCTPWQAHEVIAQILPRNGHGPDIRPDEFTVMAPYAEAA